MNRCGGVSFVLHVALRLSLNEDRELVGHAILSANCTRNMILAHPSLLSIPNVGISLASLFRGSILCDVHDSSPSLLGGGGRAYYTLDERAAAVQRRFEVQVALTGLPQEMLRATCEVACADVAHPSARTRPAADFRCCRIL